ncbi:MAG: DUF4912 domain-containing protein [Deltaproteobacteria bacterium]|nr:DUF4912 domain-containing protein [Deltaproteobacteria bacterium]
MADVSKVRKVLGLARAEVLSAAALAKRTRAKLLEAAEALGLAGLGELQKAPLAQRLLAALEKEAEPAAKAPARAAKPAAPARKTAPASAAKAPPRPAAKKAAKAGPPAAEAPGKAEARTSAKVADKAPRNPARAFARTRPAAGTRKKAPAAAAQAPEQEPAGVAKLDLGPAAHAGQRPVAHIPWGYGQDRITAAAIDPDRLFVWWELTDPAIEKARARLGAGGPGAWPNLRLYDTSGRIFDGTNALGYTDQRVERSDRRWFLEVGKPGSTAVVEIGLKSHEGFFVRVARSGRVDFPRKTGAPWTEPEWMTVLPDGAVRRGGGSHRAIPAGPGPVAGPGPLPPATAVAAPGEPATLPLWVLREAPAPEEIVKVLLEGSAERVEWRQEGGQGWVELQGSVEWVGPHAVTTWQAGPFPEPIEIEPPSAESWQGRAFAYKVGNVTHVVHGPWQVVIRNLGARTERAELGRWQVFRSWVATAGREVRAVEVRPPVALGASEGMAGASERRWLEGSELRLGGASEVWRASASELRLGGASEQRFVGASEWMVRGASERRLQGGSELRLGGASERRLQGGSELRLGGASEQVGGSEGRLAPPGDPGAAGAYPKVGG